MTASATKHVVSPQARMSLARSAGDLGAIVAEIRETHRQRQDLLRADVSLTNQIKAIRRRVDGGHGVDQLGSASLSIGVDVMVPAHAIADLAAFPLLDAQATLRVHLAPLRKRLERLAKQLPVWSDFAADVRGVGALGLAQIVGEAGDLALYPNPAKLWKRMGLGLVDGSRQRRVAGDSELAIRHGYSPKRRSIMWVIGDGLVMHNRDGAYRTYYLAEKQRQRVKLGQEASAQHVHRRAHRHMEKRLLRDLWRAWRAEQALSANREVPDTLATDHVDVRAA